MKFSIIIFNYDWNLCKDTVAGIENSAEYSPAETEIRIADLTEAKQELPGWAKEAGCAGVYRLTEGEESLTQILEQSKGQYIMMLDSGDLPDEGCLEALSCGLEDEPAAAVTVTAAGSEEHQTGGQAEKNGYWNLRDKWKMLLKKKQSFVLEKQYLMVPFEMGSMNPELETWCRTTFALASLQSVRTIRAARVAAGPFSGMKQNPDVDSLQQMISLLDVMGDRFNSYFMENMKMVPLILQYQQLSLISELLKSSELLRETLSGDELDALSDRMLSFVQKMDYTVLLTDALNRVLLLYACQQDPAKNLKLFRTGKEYLFYDGNQKLMNLSRYNFKLHFIRIHKNRLYLEGISCSPLKDGPSDVCIRVNDRVYSMKMKPHNTDIYWLDQKVCDSSIFYGTLKLDPEEKEYDISFFVRYDDLTVEKNQIQFGKFAPIEGSLKGSYYYREGWLLEFDGETSHLKLRVSGPAEQKKKEKEFEALLLKRPEPAARKAALARKTYFAQKKSKREIWLISDRTNRGDDNGEAFFRYVMSQKDRLKDKDIYFVIEKGSAGYEELKKIGKVVSPMTWKHKFLHLSSSYVISSQGNDPVVNPFHRKHIYYKDLTCDMRFVFLQHGITKDNQSAWLNKYNRNIYGLITTTQEEYDSMLEYDYYYTKDRIWLTGMPRYDLLYHDEKKYITIMPTWRKSLMSGTDVETGIWQLKDGFEESSYLQFYNALLNNEELIAEAQKLGYTICFMPHPNIAPYVSYFTKHPAVEFFDAGKSYRQVFAEADLMLTDYSSVAFDFAYLRKPIVYSQFDYEEFFSGSHSYTEGYFDYERDGFGEITHDLQSTVDLLIDYMRNGCELKPVYRERIDATFAFSDDNCSEQVLKKILGEE